MRVGLQRRDIQDKGETTELKLRACFIMRLLEPPESSEENPASRSTAKLDYHDHLALRGRVSTLRTAPHKATDASGLLRFAHDHDRSFRSRGTHFA